jgi:methyl-accepting chemotaxis protein
MVAGARPASHEELRTMAWTMHWMRQLSIRFRMRAAIAVVLALFAVVGVTGLLGGRELAALNDAFAHHTLQETRQAATMRLALRSLMLHERDMLLAYETPEALRQHRQTWQHELAQLTQQLEAMLEGEEDEDNVIARQALLDAKAYANATTPVLDQIERGVFDNPRAAGRMLVRAHAQLAKLDQQAQAIDKLIATETELALASSKATMRQLFWAFAAVLAATVLVVVPLTLLNSMSITRPIGQAQAAALAIASGDLTGRIGSDGADEAGELLRALSHMQNNLRALVQEVHGASAAIHMTSDEVASGNGDLSGRTERTAGHLQQTASAMQQLTHSVQQSADSARHARAMAESASQVAGRGGAVVTQVVRTMEQIDTAAHRIADIIGTIDGIAFQTNILALNAAVEAARAGEQGRGFAVVASEVRALAQRSAAAAREIKQLIQASVDQVSQGSQLVKQAGATMTDIMASVERVHDIIGEITQATAEQSQGIGQVNTSIGQLEQATHQNAALVEQSAAAADSLRDQAGRLGTAVARFRLVST